MHILAACSHVVDIFNTLRGFRSGEACRFGRIEIGGIGLERSLAKNAWSRCSGSWRSSSVVSSKALIFSRVKGQDRESA